MQEAEADKRIEVVIADDHAVVRRGLRSMIEEDPGIMVVGEADSMESALEAAKHHLPDVVLTDLCMPHVVGPKLCEQVSLIDSGIRVIVLSAYFNHVLVEACMRAGASGYLLKETKSLDLPQKIREVMDGKTVVDPEITALLVDHLCDKGVAIGSLSPREIEVLSLMGEGLTNSEIAKELFLSENTVKAHIKEIMPKLQARNRVTAILKARELHII